MTSLPIAPDLDLPTEVITERMAFVGQSGSGKTFGAMRLAECMLHLGAQVVGVDPVGPWWGLRSSADGLRPGYPILVLGGTHGDVPLAPDAGAVVAELLAAKKLSAVLDVSDFTLGQMHRFVSEFAERFFEAKKRSPGPVHLFWEEAHTFMPQNLPPDPGAAVMLHRVERIVRVGRNHGIGCTMISQTPQAVAKKALNQAAALFAMRMLGKHERKATAEWVGDNALSLKDLDLVKQLPSLETGEAFLVSPNLLRLSRRVRIGKRVTFDASKTPTFGADQVGQPKAIAEVDVEALRKAMAEATLQAEEEKPKGKRSASHAEPAEETKQLQAQLVEVRAELQRATAAQAAPREPEVIYKPHPSELRRLELSLARLSGLLEQSQAIAAVAEDLRGQLTLLQSTVRLLAHPEHQYPAPPAPRAPAPARPEVSAPKAVTPADPAAWGELTTGQQAMLRCLALSYRPKLSRKQLAMLADLTASGGSFQTNLGFLRARGYVDTNSDVAITAAGRQLMGEVRPKGTPAEVVSGWRKLLPRSAGLMLEHLAAVPQQAVPRSVLAARTQMTPSGGAFQAQLGLLQHYGLAEKRRGGALQVSSYITGSG